MFYTRISNLKIGKGIKFLLLYIDNLVVTFFIMFAVHRIVMLFYDIPAAVFVSIISRTAGLAFIYTAMAIKDPLKLTEKPKFFRVLMGSLIVGAIVGFIANLNPKTVAHLPRYVAVIGVSLMSALLMMCIYYLYRFINKRSAS